MPSIIDFEPSNFTSLDPIYLPIEHIEVTSFNNLERYWRCSKGISTIETGYVPNSLLNGGIQVENAELTIVILEEWTWSVW